MALPRPAAATGSEEELLARAASGDTHAFARIVRLHHEAMTRIALVVATGDAGTAESVVTEAFGRAWARLRRPLRRQRRPSDPGTWLAWLAAASAAHRVESEAALRAGIRDYEPETGERVDRTPLTAVPARDRALLALIVVAGLSADDIAAAAGRPPAFVRSEVERAFAGASRALYPVAGGTGARHEVESEVRGLAAADVPPVDPDLVARRAIRAQDTDWRWVVSIVVSASIGLAVATHPYWAPLLR